MRAAFKLMIVVPLIAGCGAAHQRMATSGAPLSGEPVAADVTLLRGRFVAGAQPDGNTVLLRGDDGLVVIDSGRHAQHTARIIDAARAAGAPVVAIVNTHWHLDHVAGNVMLREAYPAAEVYASDAINDALHGFLADYRAQLTQMLDKPEGAPLGVVQDWREEVARIDAGPRLQPTQVVTAGQDRTLAGRRVYLGLERNAVSGGDVWLLDRRTRTLVAGDLVTLPAPLFDTACAEGWRAALQRLDAMDFERLIPGHGAPMTRAQFADYRNAFDRLLACAASDASTESCRAGWLHDAQALIPEGDIPLATGLLDYYVAQILRAPAERRGRYCRLETHS
jgi:glyoxylase-like metal-dependent hydrolase (beta-lactamase superfamily II)